IGGFSSPPNSVGVRVSAISRIATRRSGREPSTWILREPGIGRVTDSDSCSVCCCREAGTAFMAFVLVGLDEAAAQGPAGRPAHEARTTGHASHAILRSGPTTASPGAGATGLSEPATGRYPRFGGHLTTTRRPGPVDRCGLWERPWPRLACPGTHRGHGRSHGWPHGRPDRVRMHDVPEETLMPAALPSDTARAFAPAGVGNI